MKMPHVNIHDGTTHSLENPTLPFLVQSFEMVFQQYHCHREAKSFAPDGSRCKPDTAGLLKRHPGDSYKFSSDRQRDRARLGTERRHKYANALARSIWFRYCEFDTRGLLQRAHIAANWPPIYIGKESDKHWEEGEDLSLLDFKTIEYRRKGNAVATDEQLARIAKVPKREFMRRGINQHTLEKICRREPVRASKLAECIKVLEE
jgi:hypothetical protein